jgi:hypothetical protein
MDAVAAAVVFVITVVPLGSRIIFTGLAGREAPPIR